MPTTKTGGYLSQNQISAYINNKNSFIPDLTPDRALEIPGRQAIYILEKKLGYQFYPAFQFDKSMESPAAGRPDGRWLREAKMVGINVRTVGDFWGVVKYMLTIPKAQNAIHLLPVWEPGVVSSLYGISSWNINPEFFSAELCEIMPHLDTVEKQLKALVNILHALGKTVGMDVIPHTDRFSEQALANPQCFEWLQRIDDQIVKHTDGLHTEVQELIFRFVRQRHFQLTPDSAAQFFSKNFPEAYRTRLLFGDPADYKGRLQRREELIELLYHYQYETVPATMGPPYRGLEVDGSEGAKNVDEKGRVWRDFKITRPESFSRVFGPLARYKLYANKNDNADWEIDFNRPLTNNWEYVAGHYAEIQSAYGFDFMRGDMAHVQMRPGGPPAEPGEYYDLLSFIKRRIRQRAPYFGSFAETFLAPPGVMAYGDEVAHLEKSASDSTLGDLQSMTVGSDKFMEQFALYDQILRARQVAPNFTILTADKDDPRFDEFYLAGNEIRYFIALFLTDMPSYMALGFETRDPHPKTAPNEHYTKLYVFYLSEGPKKREGPYVWGQNMPLYHALVRMKIYSDLIDEKINGRATRWIVSPQAAFVEKVMVWALADSDEFIFVAYLNTETPMEKFMFPANGMAGKQYSLDFSTSEEIVGEPFRKLDETPDGFELSNLQVGEGRIYRQIN